MIPRQTLLLAAIITGLMFIGAGLGILTAKHYPGDPSPAPITGLLWPNPKRLTDFTVTDHTGASFNLGRLRGHWSLMFFGYTHCPDVCPLTLSVLSSIQDRLPAGTQTLFVTVDPARDTTERLAEYIHFFDDRMIALGGTRGQIDDLASQIGIVWSLGPATADGSYPVNHSTAIFLIDPEARLVGIFSAPHQPDTLVSGISEIHHFISRQN